MNKAVHQLSASMINQFNRIDKISHNLANVNTTAYKQEGVAEGTFNNYLQEAAKKGFKPTAIDSITNTMPKINDNYIDESTGAIISTGNNLDFALKNKDTFFKLRDDQGDIVYTRDGTFHNLDGVLVSKNGYEVLNTDNEAILLEDNDTIALELGIVKSPMTNLEKLGDNNYIAKDELLVDTLFVNEGFVIQGALEKSNVNGVTSMIALIDAHRRMGQAQKVIEGISQLGESLVDKVGRPT
ncbi:MAG: flagellar hook-basal body complex protein [Arcobacter butzleri]|jgi:flagellar basal-body rod protein FlgG|nr:flagellar hook-basal body complex protein [Arcobacteraceae bacterium]MDY0365538.1 flagellar hook-basal body complex protein [Arcobacteraceae bacterium]NLO17733.1 flagellar hook-basal body complex protein [Aliarcobacter butzleri]